MRRAVNPSGLWAQAAFGTRTSFNSTRGRSENFHDTLPSISMGSPVAFRSTVTKSPRSVSRFSCDNAITSATTNPIKNTAMMRVMVKKILRLDDGLILRIRAPLWNLEFQEL